MFISDIFLQYLGYFRLTIILLASAKWSPCLFRIIFRFRSRFAPRRVQHCGFHCFRLRLSIEARHAKYLGYFCPTPRMFFRIFAIHLLTKEKENDKLWQRLNL